MDDVSFPFDALFNILVNCGQDHKLEGLRERINQERSLRDSDFAEFKQLVEENWELKLRLGLLVRLLISKGVISAPEYAALIADAQPEP